MDISYSFIPSKLISLESTVHLSIDCGSILTKLLYNELEPAHSIRFYNFPTVDLERNLTFLCKEVLKPEEAGVVNVRITGARSDEAESVLRSLIRVNVTLVDEVEALERGFYFLMTNNVYEKDFLYDYCDMEVNEYKFDESNQMLKRLNAKANSNKPDNVKHGDDKISGPAIVVWAGAKIRFYILREDRSMLLVYQSAFGGVTYTNLAKYLSDNNDYDEISKLAFQGNRENVDTQVFEVFSNDPRTPYGMIPPNLPIISFGKCDDQNNGKEYFKKEDLMDSLVLFFLGENLNVAIQLSQAYGTNTIYFGGNTFSAPVFHKHIILRQKMIFKNYKIKTLNCQYLPALGSLFR